MKEAVKLGLIYGLASIISTLITMSISKTFMFSGKAMLISLVLSAVVLIGGGRYFLRKIEDIDLSYGVAVKYLFVASIIGSIAGFVFTAGMYGDNEDLKVGFKEYQMSIMESSMTMAAKMTGASEGKIEEMKEEIKEKIDNGEIDLDAQYPFQWSKWPTNLGMSLILSLIFVLIFANFVKVKHPQ